VIAVADYLIDLLTAVSVHSASFTSGVAKYGELATDYRVIWCDCIQQDTGVLNGISDRRGTLRTL